MTTPPRSGNDIIVVAPSAVVRQRVSLCFRANVDEPREVAHLRAYAKRQTNFEIWKRARFERRRQARPGRDDRTPDAASGLP